MNEPFFKVSDTAFSEEDFYQKRLSSDLVSQDKYG